MRATPSTGALSSCSSPALGAVLKGSSSRMCYKSHSRRCQRLIFPPARPTHVQIEVQTRRLNGIIPQPDHAYISHTTYIRFYVSLPPVSQRGSASRLSNGAENSPVSTVFVVIAWAPSFSCARLRRICSLSISNWS